MAHGNVEAAVLPAQLDVLPPSEAVVVRMMGGPPFTHFAGGGPTTTPGTQLLPEQPWPAGHVLPHDPQLVRSVERSTQLPLQFDNVPGHVPVQVPETQTCPVVHTVLHPPQWAGSPEVGMHCPLHKVW
jgi:hypothetical protein